MPRAHNKTHFFKYTTADTARIILAGSSIRFSAPRTFNDPFDHQVSFRFRFTAEEAVRSIIEAQRRIIFDLAEPSFIEDNALGLVSRLLRATKGARSEADLMPQLAEAAALIGNENLTRYEQQLTRILREQLSRSRVLCMTEQHDNVVMWSHYADQHRGAVLRLDCIDETDDNILIARPVQYVTEFPDFVSADQWATHLTGEHPIDYDRLLFEPAFIKHQDWSYEREWRVHIPMMPGDPDGDGHQILRKDRRIFGGLYFGCRIEPAAREDLIATARRDYPQLQVFQSRQADRAFGLAFERIE